MSLPSSIDAITKGLCRTESEERKLLNLIETLYHGHRLSYILTLDKSLSHVSCLLQPAATFSTRDILAAVTARLF